MKNREKELTEKKRERKRKTHLCNRPKCYSRLARPSSPAPSPSSRHARTDRVTPVAVTAAPARRPAPLPLPRMDKDHPATPPDTPGSLLPLPIALPRPSKNRPTLPSPLLHRSRGHRPSRASPPCPLAPPWSTPSPATISWCRGALHRRHRPHLVPRPRRTPATIPAPSSHPRAH